ncbi:MAG TPA: POTRA domain-containing protein [Terriglobales bacterium]|nr:POTRA domain-containing protein [Terriglobales bacterium]
MRAWLIPLLLMCAAPAPASAQAPPAPRPGPPWDRPVLQRRDSGPRSNKLCPPAFWEALPQFTYAPKVTVESVRFAGAGHVPAEVLEKIAAHYQGKSFTGPGWPEELSEAVRDAEQQQGYFCAQAETAPQTLSGNSLKEQRLAITVRVWEGEQYRLKLYLWREATVFSPAQLAAMMPLRPGEVFYIAKVREGLETLRQAYARRGRLGFQAWPETELGAADNSIALILNLNEGPVYRMGTLQILGLPEELARRIARAWRPKPGQPYDGSEPGYIFERFRGQLPQDAAPASNTRLKVDDATATVDVVLDFRGSS